MGLGIVPGVAGDNIPGKWSLDGLSIGLDLQAEYRFSGIFSGFASANYNFLISTDHNGGTAGLILVHAGPRIYFTKQTFAGIGLGYGGLYSGGLGANALNFEPQFGINKKKAQFILGFNALTYNGYIVGILNLKLIFKF